MTLTLRQELKSSDVELVFDNPFEFMIDEEICRVDSMKWDAVKKVYHAKLTRGTCGTDRVDHSVESRVRAFVMSVEITA